jgi:hypothetical protein
LESWKETYRYDYYGRIIESIGYGWNVSEWEPGNKYEYAYLVDTTEEIEYNWDGSDWEPKKKREYATDANSNQILEAYYDWSDTVWIGDYKSVFAYDSEGRLILREDYSDWNDTTNTWIGDRKMVSAYDSEGRLILEEDYNAWNDTAGTWIGNNKRVSAYDSEGRLILEESYNAWNDTAGTWIGNTKKIYTYDGDDKPSIEERYGWSDSTDTWIETDKFTYTYAHGMELDKHHYVWNTDSNDWQEMEKTIGTIHPDGGISLRMAYQWSGSAWDTAGKRETMAYDTLGNMLETEVIHYDYNSGWEEKEKRVYTWDTNDKWTEIIIYYYNASILDWDTMWKIERNYDTYGNLIMEAYYFRNGAAWQGILKGECAYDTNGNQTMYAYYDNWSSGAWVGSWKYECAYDINGNQTMTADYFWSSGAWVGNEKWEYAYNANGDQIVKEHSIWDDINNTWKKDSKTERAYTDTYIYKTDDFELYEKYYEWDGAAWKLQGAMEFTYNTMGDMISMTVSELSDGGSLYMKQKNTTTHDTTSLRAGLVFDEQNELTFGTFTQRLRADLYGYDTVGTMIMHDSMLFYWSSINVWSLPTYTISGKVTLDGNPLKDVKITYATNQWVTTDSYGEYTVSDVDSGSTLVLVPSKEGYTFTPTSITCPNVSGNLFNKDFQATDVGTLPTYTISGKVTVNGDPLTGVQITYAPSKSVTTNSSGEYIVSVDSGSTVVLKPSKAGYTFTPASITCPDVSGNLSNKDFQATKVGITDVNNTNTELVVYPNPTKGIVYISSKCDIKLYDIQGKKLKEIRSNQIDISSYPQGMYFLKVEGKTLKIVKE